MAGVFIFNRLPVFENIPTPRKRLVLAIYQEVFFVVKRLIWVQYMIMLFSMYFAWSAGKNP